jgi:hypothetical protein
VSSLNASDSANSRLALIALCGDLVLALEAQIVHQIRRAADTRTSVTASGLLLLEIDGEVVPAWNIGSLLDLSTSADALYWVLVDVPSYGRRVAFGLDKCLAVQSLPEVKSIPDGIFHSRRGAIIGGFSCAPIADVEGYPTGVVLNAGGLLNTSERALLLQLSKDHR